MKKLRFFILAAALLALVTGARAQKLTDPGTVDADTWSLQSVTPPAVIKLNGQDIGQQDVAVKIKIKNKGKNQTKGDEVKINVKLYEGSKTIAEKEFTFTPPKTKNGISYTKTVTVNITDPGTVDADKINVDVWGDPHISGKLTKNIKIEKQK